MTNQQPKSIESVLNAHRKYWMGLENVVGVGQSEYDGQPVIKIFLETDCNTGIPSIVDGIPLVFEVSGKIIRQLPDRSKE